MKCKVCGTIFASPRSNDQNFYINLASSYLNPIENYFPHVSIPGFLFLLDQVESRWFKSAMARGRMIEVGCAVGYFLAGARARGWDVEGVEPIRSAAEWGKKYLQLKIQNSTLDRADVKPGSEDVVVGLGPIFETTR
jgi:hypothetical protein